MEKSSTRFFCFIPLDRLTIRAVILSDINICAACDVRDNLIAHEILLGENALLMFLNAPKPTMQKAHEGGLLSLSQSSAIRVLIVDDFQPFRALVCSILESRPNLQVIGEAFDGPDAVQKATELKPDLILLDVGLPTMNGIETARRIHTLVPESKILFLSLESSAEVVEEALATGACAYVLKTKIGSQLLAAVDAASCRSTGNK